MKEELLNLAKMDLSVGIPLCPYGIAYRRTYGLSTYGLYRYALTVHLFLRRCTYLFHYSDVWQGDPVDAEFLNLAKMELTELPDLSVCERLRRCRFRATREQLRTFT